MNCEQIKTAIANKQQLFWHDPEHFVGNDYRIKEIFELDEDNDTCLIHYGLGDVSSEAEVYLDEIKAIPSKNTFVFRYLTIVESFGYLDISMSKEQRKLAKEEGLIPYGTTNKNFYTIMAIFFKDIQADGCFYWNSEGLALFGGDFISLELFDDETQHLEFVYCFPAYNTINVIESLAKGKTVKYLQVQLSK